MVDSVRDPCPRLTPRAWVIRFLLPTRIPNQRRSVWAAKPGGPPTLCVLVGYARRGYANPYTHPLPTSNRSGHWPLRRSTGPTWPWSPPMLRSKASMSQMGGRELLNRWDFSTLALRHAEIFLWKAAELRGRGCGKAPAPGRSIDTSVAGRAAETSPSEEKNGDGRKHRLAFGLARAPP